MRSFCAVLAVFLGLGCFTILPGCQSTKQPGIMLTDIRATSDDESAVLNTIADLQKYISAGEWDKWLALCSDDVVLTAGEKNVSKEEMRKSVQGGAIYIITDLEILKTEVGPEDAVVSTRARGNGQRYYETYTLKKIDGNWLIVKETNP